MNILRGLGGRVLGCGCLVGLYETYSARTVAILDARDAHCTDPTHEVGASLDLSSLDISGRAATESAEYSAQPQFTAQKKAT